MRAWTPGSAGSPSSGWVENSVQADFDGSPMVTDTMCDEDILALGEVLAERDEGFIQITQAHRRHPGRSRLPREAGRRGPTPDPAQRRRPLAARIPRCIAVRCAGSTSAATRVCPSTPSAAPDGPGSRSRWSIGTSTTPRPAWRAITTGTKEERMAKMRDPELREAVVRESEEADRRLQVIQAGVGGNPAQLVIQGVNRQADLQKYVGRSVGDIAADEGKHRHRDHAGPVPGRRSERRVPRPGQGIERRVHGGDDQRVARTRSPACPTAGPTPSSSPVGPGRRTS